MQRCWMYTDWQQTVVASRLFTDSGTTSMTLKTGVAWTASALLVRYFPSCPLSAHSHFRGAVECYSENVWMARCKVTSGLVSIQSWPKATADIRLRLYNMAELVSVVHEQAPLVHRVFDVIEDKGAVLVVSELCAHGTLWDAILECDAGKIVHIPWLVCEVQLSCFTMQADLAHHPLGIQ